MGVSFGLPLGRTTGPPQPATLVNPKSGMHPQAAVQSGLGSDSMLRPGTTCPRPMWRRLRRLRLADANGEGSGLVMASPVLGSGFADPLYFFNKPLLPGRAKKATFDPRPELSKRARFGWSEAGLCFVGSGRESAVALAVVNWVATPNPSSERQSEAELVVRGRCRGATPHKGSPTG